MNYHRYSNFVRPLSTEISTPLSGEEAKKLYLEEIIENTKDERCSTVNHDITDVIIYSCKSKIEEIDISNHKLFDTAQRNDVYRLRRILDTCPDKINAIDEFGWSLLMISCQANSVDTVRELLNRGIDVTIRDKAGNSAQSLVIKNKNYLLADILLNRLKCTTTKTVQTILKSKNKVKEKYACTICDGKLFDSKKEHLSSTVHNLNVSKERKFPTNYVIPESNKGYQIMLKVGWDKEVGLGPNGSGKKYPIKTVQKLDKKGLGHENIKKSVCVNDKDSLRKGKKKVSESDYEKHRRMEISFRREFY